MTQTTSQVEAAEREKFEAWFAKTHWPNEDAEEQARAFNDPSWGRLIRDSWVVWLGRAALASQQEVAEGDYKNMWLAAVSTLAKIDALLGLPEDGCNDPDYTLSALQDYMAGVAEVTRTDVPYTLDDVRAWIKQGQDRAASQQEVVAPVGDADVNAAIRDIDSVASHCFVTFKAMRHALENFAASRVPVASPAVPIKVTDAMVETYLTANDDYWARTDQMPDKNPSKWRQGTPKEATRESLNAVFALLATPPVGAGDPVKAQRPINCGTGYCSCIECLFDAPFGAGGAGVMDARPETMEIRYETFGNCLWHTDCKVNSFKSGVMQVLSHEKTSSTMKCLSCGQVGAYPKGRVGTVCVPVISTDAAILASKGGDQGEGK